MGYIKYTRSRKKMKKRKKGVIAVSLITTMAADVLSGCGTKKSDTMTISEMLETVLKDEQ
jgi:hypothetical protein